MTTRTRTPRLLVIDDQARSSAALTRHAPELTLMAAGGSGDNGDRRHARSWREAEAALARHREPPDLVVLDLRFELPDEELLPDERPLGTTAAARKLRNERQDTQGLLILERLRRRHPDLAVVMTTAFEEIPFEEEAVRLRADAFTYAVGEDEASGAGLARAVLRVLAERQAPETTGRFFWGRTARMRELRRRLAALAPTPLPILVSGPTGSGKNLLVREALHPASGRKGLLVPFDCATVPESLLQSALFGTVRGAYTGAVADRPGVFEAARDGTLFLDEVENLASDAQKALLTAIDEGTVRRLGATASVRHGARVVAASNHDLRQRVAEGTFRADLLMRLNPALALELPALAERREDLPDLAAMVSSRFAAEPAHRTRIAALARAAGGREPGSGGRGAGATIDVKLALGEDAAAASSAAVLFALPGKAWKAALRHPWPGNLRQFEMVLGDLLATALYGGPPPVARSGNGVLFDLDARLLFDLLAAARAPEAAGAERLALPRPRAATVPRFRLELERAAMRSLFQEAEGDFERLAELMTGSRRHARAARLRFNRLGLSAREEK